LDYVIRAHETDLAVWAPAATAPPELTLPEYGFRPLGAIRAPVEEDSDVPNHDNIIVLATSDHGFRQPVKAAKARGERISVLTVKNDLS
jgi:hypothetical protein